MGLEDSRFADFIHKFNSDFREKVVSNITYKNMENVTYAKLDKEPGTKDKVLITAKLELIETLMNDFLHISNEDLKEVNTLEFIKENVKENATEEDIEFYSDILDDLTVEVDNNTKLLDEHNRPSLIALVGYACENEIDDKLVEWVKEFFVKNFTYKLNQVENFTYMKNSLQKMADA